MNHKIIVTPRATEKAYAASKNNEYIFNVPLNANKNQIVEAIEANYDVKVLTIKTLVQAGKSIRFSRGKNRYPGNTKRSDSKKAYVRLADGDSIRVFDEAPVEAPVEATDKKETK